MTATHTHTATTTISISASDVRHIMRLIMSDIQAICRAASHAAQSFNMDEALVDASLLVLNSVASAVNLEIHKEGTIIREYRFLLNDSSSGPSGPPAGQPPLGYVPPGARIRLSITPDQHLPVAERQAWFDRLGWTTAEPLSYAPETTQTAYGSFVSGGLRVQRQLMSNPHYDRSR